MEGHNCNNICSWTHKPATDSKKKKEKEIPERVTLKKEIGLLSACTIIIGEAGKQAACSAPFLTLLLQKFSSRFCLVLALFTRPEGLTGTTIRPACQCCGFKSFHR
uniref:Uncharacterized protein n=1 Tax=Poecilia mexicana TaxID=48701 RepID=A0A3B3YFK0_9TELE